MKVTEWNYDLSNLPWDNPWVLIGLVFLVIGILVLLQGVIRTPHDKRREKEILNEVDSKHELGEIHEILDDADKAKDEGK